MEKAGIGPDTRRCIPRREGGLETPVVILLSEILLTGCAVVRPLPQDRPMKEKCMFLFGIGAMVSAVLFGLWLWIDDKAATEESPKGSRDAQEADAEFERTMKDIEDGK
ncbi:MAG: hypothetical protein ABF893_02705 [Gluconacetobacter liquefaciens]|uniref:hypothetical protein n=1 Tax=Gluconacetobacter liquefaciens TaxID=89584 RepID=UPI0014773615|nr:hypothetical protein [Gluconacetobacter liquefaciens]